MFFGRFLTDFAHLGWFSLGIIFIQKSLPGWWLSFFGHFLTHFGHLGGHRLSSNMSPRMAAYVLWSIFDRFCTSGLVFVGYHFHSDITSRVVA